MDWQQPPPAGAAPGAATQLPPPVTTGSAAAPPHHAKTTQMVRPPVPLGPVAAAPTKRVGRKGAGRRIMSVGAAEPEELVKLGPEISRTSERLRTGWRPVQLSAEDKATPVVLDDRQLTASSSAGYSMVRATHGAFTGTWYYEVKVDQLGPTGAARIGWSTRHAELNAPVGADKCGFSYRSAQGSKVHAAWRDDYGEPFGQGDVVGCVLHMPEGGRPFERGVADVVKYKGKLYFEEQEQADPQKLPGSFVAFTLNGRLQGKAYEDIAEGTYCPAISLYTNPTKQQTAATVTVNFGEQGFAFDPPQIDGCQTPRPAFEMAGPRPGQQQQQPEQRLSAQGQAASEQLEQQQARQATEPPEQHLQQEVRPMEVEPGAAPAQQQQSASEQAAPGSTGMGG